MVKLCQDRYGTSKRQQVLQEDYILVLSIHTDVLSVSCCALR